MTKGYIKRYELGREVYSTLPKLNLKTCLSFLDYLDSKGVWLISFDMFHLAFRDKKRNLMQKLAYFIRAGLIIKVIKGLYANPRARSRPNPLFLPYQVAKHLRPKDIFYESLESMAFELSLISQCPNRVTFVTSGKAQTYFTSFGIIEFVHKNINQKSFEELLEKSLIFFDNEKKIYCATGKLVKEDMKELKRSVDLLHEAEEIA